MDKNLKKIAAATRLKSSALLAIILATALNPGTPWRD
jgi:hypothetical protein